jgi:hypothetical protein
MNPRKYPCGKKWSCRFFGTVRSKNVIEAFHLVRAYNRSVAPGAVGDD